MKKTISLWLAALMLAAQPIQAAVCVGFGQSGSSPDFYDEFDNPTGADVNIKLHSPNIGDSLSWKEDAGNGRLPATSSYMQSSTSGGTRLNNTTVMPGADYTVSMQVTMNTTTGTYFASICARVGSSFDGAYCLKLFGNGNIELSEYTTNGAWVRNIDTDIHATYSSTTEYILALTVSGQTISGTITPDGPTLTGTDATITGAGTVGVIMNGGNIFAIDNISAE